MTPQVSYLKFAGSLIKSWRVRLGERASEFEQDPVVLCFLGTDDGRDRYPPVDFLDMAHGHSPCPIYSL